MIEALYGVFDLAADQLVTEIKTEEDLVGPGAAPGTVPTDIEQATGLERLEILGKMEGVDVFDMRPLDASRRGKHTPGPSVMACGIS